ncbi:YbaB/EbfC family nucleoid-associated protein [Streptomyces sp. NPDC090053]|uniref:YbaB/EbfC family nucleoid-associated protein n=1 Tax=Streptomyces sp. NPDC090053 TaxID=3365932 RepID=UPI00380297FD
MSSAYDNRLAALMGEFTERMSLVRGAQESLEGQSVTARSKDRSVTVVGDVRGGIRKITFDTDDFRDMAPAELGALLVGTIAEVRQQASAKVREAFAPVVAASAGPEDLAALEELKRSLRGMPEQK